jgi:hypothetical protein
MINDTLGTPAEWVIGTDDTVLSKRAAGWLGINGVGRF